MDKCNKLESQSNYLKFIYHNIIALNCAGLEELRLLQTKIKV